MVCDRCKGKKPRFRDFYKIRIKKEKSSVFHCSKCETAYEMKRGRRYRWIDLILSALYVIVFYIACKMLPEVADVLAYFGIDAERWMIILGALLAAVVFTCAFGLALFSVSTYLEWKLQKFTKEKQDDTEKPKPLEDVADRLGEVGAMVQRMDGK